MRRTDASRWYYGNKRGEEIVQRLYMQRRSAHGKGFKALDMRKPKNYTFYSSGMYHSIAPYILVGHKTVRLRVHVRVAVAHVNGANAIKISRSIQEFTYRIYAYVRIMDSLFSLSRLFPDRDLSRPRTYTLLTRI